MTDNEIQFRKKREINDIFRDTFEFIGQEYKPISKLVGIGYDAEGGCTRDVVRGRFMA